MKKKKALPSAFVSPTKDTRFAGTFEVLVPLPDRNKPHRVPMQFESEHAAESWIYGPEGQETIERLLQERRE